MTLLLMDTSGEYTVLALANPAEHSLHAVRVFEGRRTLSRRLLSEVQGLLTGEGMRMEDVTAFGIGLGPGSFTGVRVGVTTAKTFAQVTGKPLLGVPTMDAYALGWRESGAACAVVLPSRRGEAYAAIYAPSVALEDAVPFAEPYAALGRRLAFLAQQGPLICCGAVGLLSDGPALSYALPFVPPEGLARAAAQRLALGRIDDALALTPLYVVAPSISKPREKPA